MVQAAQVGIQCKFRSRSSWIKRPQCLSEIMDLVMPLSGGGEDLLL